MTDKSHRREAIRANSKIDSAFTAPDGSVTTTISISGTAAAATGLEQDVVYRLRSDVNCTVLFADAGDAVAADDMDLTAELPEWFEMPVGVSRISAITTGATGTLKITKLG